MSGATNHGLNTRLCLSKELDSTNGRAAVSTDSSPTFDTLALIEA